ncbi:hypothetical protein GDO81_006322 [Engystomops pustulosus]|uniref:Uncharacterized protein n=1 Tax=Engystomops pustulosus TaxID=76066 RepID=A0AAV7CXN0_ENGPU|nr:hypothetical protein GDO81_006322 [Engystomops pustulosus]
MDKFPLKMYLIVVSAFPRSHQHLEVLCFVFSQTKNFVVLKENVYVDVMYQSNINLKVVIQLLNRTCSLVLLLHRGCILLLAVLDLLQITY